MAVQNLFEKYGIKEVADVTFYRIERKDEVYESQRKIIASSILKGALELKTVYPMTAGVGDEEGFQAYVFSDAEILEGTNYACDDDITLTERVTFTYTTLVDNADGDTEDEKEANAKAAAERLSLAEGENLTVTYANAITPLVEDTYTDKTYAVYEALKIDSETGKIYTTEELEDNGYAADTSETAKTATPSLIGEATEFEYDVEEVDETDLTGATKKTVTKKGYVATFKAVFKITYKNAEESATSPDPKKYPGTHEYSYPEQILMLFAKNQNLISKTGTRYHFNSTEIFDEITFNDNFAGSPNTTEKVVVCGLPGKFAEMTYDVDEVKEAINGLSASFTAKAYDVVYEDYAELIVEDEMGYYNPAYLGKNYRRNASGIAKIDFFAESTTDTIEKGYEAYAKANSLEPDYVLEGATMWGDGLHWSINDAIDALRQKKKILDVGADNGLSGLNSIYGGYKVESLEPAAGGTDLVTEKQYIYGIKDASGKDTYLPDGTSVTTTSTNYSSLYSLEKVLAILDEIAAKEDSVVGQDLKVTPIAGVTEQSNRAIYVRVDGAVDSAAAMRIYILKNKNAKQLASDKDGIFKFTDKEGNTLYYQDKIFAGKETLALVIIGKKGLIFVVNRYGTRDIDKVAWMTSADGYITNAQAKTLVKKGLIHTVDVTVNDETFEATCTVKSLKIRKTKKRVNRYVPVLFLDTLKTSTLEQSAEEVYATGGRGNANLIGWDYNKEITLTLEDALYSPASMSLMLGSYEGNDFTKGVKDTKRIDRMEKCVAERSFIVPAGNSEGVPSEGVESPEAVYIDYATMQPYQDGAPIAEGELYLKWTRNVAYDDNSIGNTIEISADKFPGTYKIVGETYARNKTTGEDQRFQFIIPQAKVSADSATITLEAEGDPTVFDMTINVLRPDDGVMIKLVQYDVVENTEEKDGSTMVKDTENLNLLDDAEMYRVSADATEDEDAIGATEY